MGKAPKRITILVHPEIAAWEEVQKLSDQGHTIYSTTGDLSDLSPEDLRPDLILHPNAWRMDAAHRKYLPLAVAAGRAKRYPKEKPE